MNKLRKLVAFNLLSILACITILSTTLQDVNGTVIQLAPKQKLCFEENIREGIPMKMRLKIDSHPSNSMLRVVGKDLSGGEKLFDLHYDLDAIQRKNIGTERDVEVVKLVEYSFTTGVISYYDTEEEMSNYQICLTAKGGSGNVELGFELEKANQYEELESVSHIQSKFVTISC